MDDTPCTWFDDHPDAPADPETPAHVAACASCRARSLLLERQLRRALAAREEPVPAALAQRVHAAVAARYGRPAGARPWLAAAALVGAALLALAIHRTTKPRAESAAPEVITAAPDRLPVPEQSPGAAVDAGPPKVKVDIWEVKVLGGTVPGAVDKVEGMTSGFRRCYLKGLMEEDPGMKGSVMLDAKVGPTGAVTSVTPNDKGLSPAVVKCIAARMGSADFKPPDTGRAFVLVPVTFSVEGQ